MTSAARSSLSRATSTTYSFPASRFDITGWRRWRRRGNSGSALGDLGQASLGEITQNGIQGAHRPAQGHALRNHVEGGERGLEVDQGDHAVHRQVDFAAEDGLQRGNQMVRQNGRVRGFLRLGGMAALALEIGLELVGRGEERSGTYRESAHRTAGPVVHAVDLVDAEVPSFRRRASPEKEHLRSSGGGFEFWRKPFGRHGTCRATNVGAMRRRNADLIFPCGRPRLRLDRREGIHFPGASRPRSDGHQFADPKFRILGPQTSNSRTVDFQFAGHRLPIRGPLTSNQPTRIVPIAKDSEPRCSRDS